MTSWTPSCHFYLVIWAVYHTVSQTEMWPIVRLIASDKTRRKNQSKPFKTSLSQWQAVKSCCWCHCRGSRVVCSAKGNAIKGAMCTLNLCLITRTIWGYRDGSDAGREVTHLTHGPLLKRSIWSGLVSGRMKEVQIGVEWTRLSQCCQYRAERRERRPAQESADVARWRTCRMFSWSYRSCWHKHTGPSAPGAQKWCSIRVFPPLCCKSIWLKLGTWCGTVVGCDVMSVHLFSFPERFVAPCKPPRRVPDFLGELCDRTFVFGQHRNGSY